MSPRYAFLVFANPMDRSTRPLQRAAGFYPMEAPERPPTWLGKDAL